jgi:hypothetical protein
MQKVGAFFAATTYCIILIIGRNSYLCGYEYPLCSLLLTSNNKMLPCFHASRTRPAFVMCTSHQTRPSAAHLYYGHTVRQSHPYQQPTRGQLKSRDIDITLRVPVAAIDNIASLNTDVPQVYAPRRGLDRLVERCCPSWGADHH